MPKVKSESLTKAKLAALATNGKMVAIDFDLPGISADKKLLKRPLPCQNPHCLNSAKPMKHLDSYWVCDICKTNCPDYVNAHMLHIPNSWHTKAKSKINELIQNANYGAFYNELLMKRRELIIRKKWKSSIIKLPK